MSPSGPQLDPAPQPFTSHSDVLISLAERANHVDRLVAQGADELLFPTIPDGIALVSVGGYGRRQLFPFPMSTCCFSAVTKSFHARTDLKFRRSCNACGTPACASASP
ncbi:MAG: hypothetical protein WDO73_33305, partial [Ignavibacteriota bacterium]